MKHVQSIAESETYTFYREVSYNLSYSLELIFAQYENVKASIFFKMQTELQVRNKNKTFRELNFKRINEQQNYFLQFHVDFASIEF